MHYNFQMGFKCSYIKEQLVCVCGRGGGARACVCVCVCVFVWCARVCVCVARTCARESVCVLQRARAPYLSLQEKCLHVFGHCGTSRVDEKLNVTKLLGHHHRWGDKIKSWRINKRKCRTSRENSRGGGDRQRYQNLWEESAACDRHGCSVIGAVRLGRVCSRETKFLKLDSGNVNMYLCQPLVPSVSSLSLSLSSLISFFRPISFCLYKFKHSLSPPNPLYKHPRYAIPFSSSFFFFFFLPFWMVHGVHLILSIVDQNDLVSLVCMLGCGVWGVFVFIRQTCLVYIYFTCLRCFPLLCWLLFYT